MNSEQRIVITGMGAISSVGLNCQETFDNLVAGKSGISRVSLFDPSNIDCQVAGEVKGFDPAAYMDRKMARRIGRYAQFSIAATQEALAQSGLDLEKEDKSRISCIVSSAIGDFPMLEEQMFNWFAGKRRTISPFTVPRVSTSMAAGNIALEYGLTGVSFGLSSACATGSHSLATAMMLLKSGQADVVLAGGAESAICETFLQSYIAMRALSTRNDEPERSSRPFDRDRDGFVIAEGCGVMVLETLANAQRRGARILAELAGAGMTCDAFHITSAHPDGIGAAQAMTAAMKSAGVNPDQVDYINAHGTSTPVNDPIETRAIKLALGESAHRIPVSSTKSMTGHAIGAAGALEAIICVKAMEAGVIPPTINLDNPDPECDLDYVPFEARSKKLDVVMSNSFAFGGQNCVLVFRKFE
ncbi:MAG: beta-ketoacyl-ACP synthase II [Xanthomonadales bacterium]|nr:beta-ketoacyl-ACP synthase II [Xanthomonadales bacterium]